MKSQFEQRLDQFLNQQSDPRLNPDFDPWANMRFIQEAQLATLLRDANPTPRDIAEKPEKAERQRVAAVNALLALLRDDRKAAQQMAEKQPDRGYRIHPSIRRFFNNAWWSILNDPNADPADAVRWLFKGVKTSKKKGRGRPRSPENRDFAIAVEVQKARNSGKSADDACEHVLNSLDSPGIKSLERVKEIYYGTKLDRAARKLWRRNVRLGAANF